MIKMKSCIVLCGGQSRRMGRDKGSLVIGDKPMISHILSTLNNEIDEVKKEGNRRYMRKTVVKSIAAMTAITMIASGFSPESGAAVSARRAD